MLVVVVLFFFYLGKLSDAFLRSPHLTFTPGSYSSRRYRHTDAKSDHRQITTLQLQNSNVNDFDSPSRIQQNFPKKRNEIPYGYNWQDVLENGLFFEDKTKLITELERFRFASLYRPSGMGKTNFCQSLRNYYDIKKKSEFHENFNGTFASYYPTPSQGSFMVLTLSLGEIIVNGKEYGNEKAFHMYINQRIKEFQSYYSMGHRYNYQIGAFYGGVSDTSLALGDSMENLETLFQAVKQQQKNLFIIIEDIDAYVTQHSSVLEILGIATMPANMPSRDVVILSTSAEIASAAAAASARTNERVLLVSKLGNVIKHYIDGDVVRRVFVTGVTPTALTDSLSSLSVILQDISANPLFEDIGGFTPAHVAYCLRSLGYKGTELTAHTSRITSLYGGYRFHPNQLFGMVNARQTMYYLQSLEENQQEPAVPADPRTEASIKRLAGSILDHSSFHWSGQDQMRREDAVVTILHSPSVPLQYLRSGGLGSLEEIAPQSSSSVFLPLTVAFYHGLLTYAPSSKSVDSIGDEPRSTIDRTRPQLVVPNALAREVLLEATYDLPPPDALEVALELETKAFTEKKQLYRWLHDQARKKSHSSIVSLRNRIGDNVKRTFSRISEVWY